MILVMLMKSKLMWMVHVVVDAHESLAMFPTLALAGNYNLVMMMISCFFLLLLP